MPGCLDGDHHHYGPDGADGPDGPVGPEGPCGSDGPGGPPVVAQVVNFDILAVLACSSGSPSILAILLFINSL